MHLACFKKRAELELKTIGQENRVQQMLGTAMAKLEQKKDLEIENIENKLKQSEAEKVSLTSILEK